MKNINILKKKEISVYLSDDKRAVSKVILEEERYTVTLYINKKEVSYENFSTLHRAEIKAEDLIFNYQNNKKNYLL